MHQVGLRDQLVNGQLGGLAGCQCGLFCYCSYSFPPNAASPFLRRGAGYQELTLVLRSESGNTRWDLIQCTLPAPRPKLPIPKLLSRHGEIHSVDLPRQQWSALRISISFPPTSRQLEKLPSGSCFVAGSAWTLAGCVRVYEILRDLRSRWPFGHGARCRACRFGRRSPFLPSVQF